MNQNRKTAFLCLTLTIAALARGPRAEAWGDLGHQTIGEIAERVLAKDPAALRAAQAIVGVEPLYLSATWPDQVRDDDRFKDFGPYHFHDIPEAGHPEEEKSAMTVFTKYPRVLADPKAPSAAKMVAYRYIVHVVGDIHQPLHAGYAGDRGGNNCIVNWKPHADRPGAVTTLHGLWDTGLVELVAQRTLPPKYGAFKKLATHLMEKYPELVAAPAVTDAQAWVDESRALLSEVYPDQLAPGARPYCKKKSEDRVPDEVIPVLGAGFADKNAALVEKRLLLAGVRLAAFLKKVMAQAPSQAPQEEILQLLKLHTH